MARSNKDAWLRPGKGDLREEEVVVDWPDPGDTVLVRALSARWAAKVQSKFKIRTEGNQQVSSVDIDEMEKLQFAHGVVEPEFSEEEAERALEIMGPAARKVIAAIDRLSGVNKEAVKAAEERFPVGGTNGDGSALADSGASERAGRSGESTLPSSTGPTAGNASRGDV